MHRAVAMFLLLATESLAHPGHGGALGHIHGWDWAQLIFGLVVVGVAALAVWKVK
jgi:hypothetical protein